MFRRVSYVWCGCRETVRAAFGRSALRTAHGPQASRSRGYRREKSAGGRETICCKEVETRAGLKPASTKPPMWRPRKEAPAKAKPKYPVLRTKREGWGALYDVIGSVKGHLGVGALEK